MSNPMEISRYTNLDLELMYLTIVLSRFYLLFLLDNVFLDLSKVFESIDHALLSRKIEYHLGINGNCLA
ncbi:hypothetical protein J437_LFUL002515 [Ladona fulva]|uniref:Uncharacterized protein n=1 Tax=Ladona fulva TaxID=123851 RepID=A0A8K0KTW3_LADFU|nr:hypothetical protein J437_LFUL002515 [Ladona fulva]